MVDLNLTAALTLVLLFTVLHGAMYVRFHRRLSLVAGSAWVLYGIYEGALQGGWICSQACNIRIDLLLIFPALALLSFVVVLVHCVKCRRW